MALFSSDFEAIIMIDFNDDLKCNNLLYMMYI